MRMNTYTGKRFDPMQMTPEEVSLRDIAHALSLLCRGGGHMKYFYTVGLHSLNWRPGKQLPADGPTGWYWPVCFTMPAKLTYPTLSAR